MNVVFFGTSSFAAQILNFLVKHAVSVVAVVTRPDKPKGRSLHLLPPPVKEELLSLAPKTPLYQPPKVSTPEFAEILRHFQADFFVVAAYGEILKPLILEIPPLGCINVHASLLPKYRGASPIQRCLMHGDEETGISIMDMVAEMDAGDVYAQVKTPISDTTTFGELNLTLSDLAGPALLQTLEKIKQGTAVKTPQDLSQVTFAPKLKPEEEQIFWNQGALKIHHQIQALSPTPGAWCYITIGDVKKRLKIKKSQVVFSPDPKKWIVPCGEGLLELLEVQLEGKKTMTAKEFLCGARHQPFLF